MEQQISRTEWKTENGNCKIIVILNGNDGDLDEYDIIEQARYTIKGLGFTGGVEESGDEDELEAD